MSATDAFKRMNVEEAQRASALATSFLAAEPPDIERAQRLFARARALAPDDSAIATAARDCDVVADALRAACGGEPALVRLLGVALGASAAELHAASRKLALRLHPDKNGSPCASYAFAAVRGAVDKLAKRRSSGSATCSHANSWRVATGAGEPSALEVVCTRCAHVSTVPAPADADETDATVAWACEKCGTRASARLSDIVLGVQARTAAAERARALAAQQARQMAALEAEELRLRTLAALARSRSTPPPLRCPLSAGAAVPMLCPADPAATRVARDATGSSCAAPSAAAMPGPRAPPPQPGCASSAPQPSAAAATSAATAASAGATEAVFKARQQLPSPQEPQTLGAAARNVAAAALGASLALGGAIGRAVGLALSSGASGSALHAERAPSAARPVDGSTQAAAPGVQSLGRAMAHRAARDSLGNVATPPPGTRAAPAAVRTGGKLAEQQPLTGTKRAASSGRARASPAARKRPCARLPENVLNIPLSRGAHNFPLAGALPSDHVAARCAGGVLELPRRVGSWPRPGAAAAAGTDGHGFIPPPQVHPRSAAGPPVIQAPCAQQDSLCVASGAPEGSGLGRLAAAGAPARSALVSPAQSRPRQCRPHADDTADFVDLTLFSP